MEETDFEWLDPRVVDCFLTNVYRIERLATGMRWVEGPVWFADHNCLLWSDVPGNRLWRWTEGGNVDVFRAPSKDVARKVSILRQENHFVTRLTVRQLVGFGRYPHSGGRLTQVDEDAISQAIDFLDMTDLEQRFLDQLSGGQRQRAYVAMVLAQDTEYLLLDEPLNNLDAQHSVEMMTQLRRAADELGRTIIIVLHDINFAAAYSDYIVAMDEGAIAIAGTPEEIITDEVLTTVFRTPVTVLDGPSGKFAVYHRS